MRAREFITEANIVGYVQVGNYTVAIDQHFLDQCRDRDVNEREGYLTLEKLPQAKAKLKNIFSGQHFWLHDNTSDISIGLYTKDQQGRRYKLNTIIGTRPQSDNKYPIVEVR